MVMAELQQLREEVRVLRQIAAPIEASRTRPFSGLQVVRLNGVVDGVPGSSDPARYWKGFAQGVIEGAGTGDIEGDSAAFEVFGIVRPNHTPFPSKYAQDVMVGLIDHFQVVLPTPGQMVFAEITSISSGVPFGVTAKYADIDFTAAPGVKEPDPKPYGVEIPVLDCNTLSDFHDSKHQYAVGEIIIARHVWPTTDEMGESTIADVDKDIGFLIAYAKPPGLLALTLGDEITLLGGEKVKLDLGVDGQGNVVTADLVYTVTPGGPGTKDASVTLASGEELTVTISHDASGNVTGVTLTKM